MHEQQTTGLVTVDYEFESDRPEWVERLFALGNFLLEYSAPSKKKKKKETTIGWKRKEGDARWFCHDGKTIVGLDGAICHGETISSMDGHEHLVRMDFDNEEITIYAFEDEHIGGLRVSEVSFTVNRPSGGIGGASYERSEATHHKFILLAEEFLATYGVEPIRPEGWESCLNPHGEVRLALLRQMGLKKAAEQEYQKQLEQEKNIVSGDHPMPRVTRGLR